MSGPKNLSEHEWKMGYEAMLVCHPPDPLERVDTPPDIAEALRRRARRIADLEGLLAEASDHLCPEDDATPDLRARIAAALGAKP